MVKTLNRVDEVKGFDLVLSSHHVSVLVYYELNQPEVNVQMVYCSLYNDTHLHPWPLNGAPSVSTVSKSYI